MSQVAIKIEKQSSGMLHVYCPYDVGWPEKARQMGGKWLSENKVWQFQAECESEVRQALLEIYGDDGSQPFYTVDAEFEGYITAKSREFHSAKRLLLRRKTYNEPVECGRGVILLQGQFAEVGGSPRSPKIGKALSPTFVCRIYHVPEYMLQHWSQFSSSMIRSSKPERARTKTEIHDDRASIQAMLGIAKKMSPELREKIESFLQSLKVEN